MKDRGTHATFLSDFNTHQLRWREAYSNMYQALEGLQLTSHLRSTSCRRLSRMFLAGGLKVG